MERVVIDPVVERSVAERLAADDVEGAATAAVRGYGPQILGYMRSALGRPELADDAFSLFCESLWKQLASFRAESALLTWSYKLAWGAVRRVASGPRRTVALSSTAMSAIVQEVRSTAPVYLRPETADRLVQIRAQLDAEEQTLLVLRVDRDLGWDEVAAIMGVAPAVLRKRFERVKAKIKKLASQTPEATH